MSTRIYKSLGIMTGTSLDGIDLSIIKSDGSNKLTLIDGEVIKFRTINQKYKIPHIGWNDISICKSNKLFNNLNNQKFYFANSYHALCNNNSDIIAESFHEYNFTSAINYKNIYGVQFHPEKSFIQGINLINNFINIQ